MPRAIAASLAVVLLAGCTANGPLTPDPARPNTGTGPFAVLDDVQLVAFLSPFAACDELLGYIQEAALELVTPYGLGGGHWGPWPAFGRAALGAMEDAPAEEAADAGGAAGADGAVGSGDTGTNVQEAGVDEPDHVKTDGRHLYVASAGWLRVLDLRGDRPVEVARLDLRDAWDAQLLLAGDHLLVTTSGPAVVPFADEPVLRSEPGDAVSDDVDIWPGPGGWGGTTTLTMVDVSEPANPVVTERLTVDGSTVSARLIDGVARVVVRTEPGRLPWEHPRTSGLRAERQALEANRQLIRDSVIEDWLPYAVHETATGDSREGMLLACDEVSRPQTFAGLGLLSVMTIDVEGGGLALDPAANVAVLAGGDTVYASREALYVATTRWIDWEQLGSDAARERRARDLTTEIHAFRLDDPARAVYAASGEVPGTLLSQWAMSEHEGVLRVASTVGSAWWGSGDRPSESVVTTLAERDGVLTQLGQVDGLGLTERIYAVRFIGDVGYVVTFREVDPLYTIDLSDPTDPEVVGELKIMGYSAYLHPVGDDLLLGVGQDADARGATKGTQLSLFDVSDPADPTRIDQVTLADAHSDAEHDHRAFMHHPASGTTVVPFTRWRWIERTGREDVDTGAVVFTATRSDGIARRGLLAHTPSWLEELRRELDDQAANAGSPDERDWRLEDQLWDWGWRGRISRSLVLDDRLVSVSELGVAVHDLRTLDERGWLAFDD